ncbi:hypothetical protein [Paenisporosarcina sp.]|uniref:hypothetical protein n=1 Tax=Paenisporosarcina sp. TaxID=1932001 RepID=UPI003C73C21B
MSGFVSTIGGKDLAIGGFLSTIGGSLSSISAFVSSISGLTKMGTSAFVDVLIKSDSWFWWFILTVDICYRRSCVVYQRKRLGYRRIFVDYRRKRLGYERFFVVYRRFSIFPYFH